MQTPLCSGQPPKFYDDTTREVYVDMTNVADRYGLNLLVLLTSEVGVVFSCHIFSTY